MGDRYSVKLNRFGSSDTHPADFGPFNTWEDAKVERNRVFFTFPEHVRAAWIMRDNLSLDLQPERRGHVMRRTKPQSELA